jgi:hypothetical protein
MTIWSSPKAAVYVEDLIAGSEEHFRPRFYVMSDGNRIGGACSMRWVDQVAFGDSVFILPELRGMHLGAKILCESFAAYRAEFPSATVAFDVFESEPVLHSWYQRLGGREQFRRSWWEIELKTDARGHSVLSGWDEAKQRVSRWGFGRFTVQTDVTTYDVGYLPGSFFRVTDPRAVSDPGLHSVLCRLDGTRKLFLFSSCEDEFFPGRRVATSIRMKANFDRFIDGLSAHLQKRRYDDASAHAHDA